MIHVQIAQFDASQEASNICIMWLMTSNHQMDAWMCMS